MTIPRIIVDKVLTDGELITITGEQYHYLVRVNRIKSGEKFYLLDGSGKDFIGEVLDISNKSFTAYIFQIKTMKKPEYRVGVIFGMLKGDKNEFIIKSGTQMGITDFYPVVTKRTIIKMNREKVAEKLQRFSKIAEDTARTSFLSFIPEVHEITDLTMLTPEERGLKLLFSEKKGVPLLKTAEKKIVQEQNIFLFFGPEGGLENDEVDFLVHKGFEPISLGERALKAEFAFVFASSVVIYIKRGEF